MQDLFTFFQKHFPLGNTLVLILVFILILGITHLFLRRDKLRRNSFLGQAFYIGISLCSLIALILTLPIDQTAKNQLLGLVGVVLSAAFALSSTTFIGNILAGILLKSIKSFKPGDFLSLEDSFGRVTRKDLFRVEIQTEDRSLVSLPNLYVATHPLKVLRSTGTIVSSSLSLGYEVPNHTLIDLLTQAAVGSGLSDCFVHIVSLGDFSVTYKVCGVLSDLDRYLSARSRLNQKILDTLHKSDIEIVSPNFMNQRVVTGETFIPKEIKLKQGYSKDPSDLVVFDKALEADKISDKEEALIKIDNQISSLQLEPGFSQNGDMQNKVNRLKSLRDKITEQIKRKKAELDQLE